MPCTDPKRCWVQGTTETGKDKYVFRPPDNYQEHETNYVPCGRCLSCQIDKSKEWATRGFHESQCHSENCFITLTYNDEHLPKYSTLDKQALRDFIRKLRDHLNYQYKKYLLECKKLKLTPQKQEKIKYIAAGEYGSEKNTYRPHYHLCIFGFEPRDKTYLFTNKWGDPVYTSELISKLWNNKGYITVSPTSFRTVAYTARYTVKKIIPKDQRKQSEYWIDTETGETNYDPVAYNNHLKSINKQEEFITMSNGIGKEWHNKYEQDTHKDYVTVNYAKHKIPRYYDKQMEAKNPERLEQIKEKRIQAAKENVKTKNKLDQENKIKQNQIKRLNRSL